MIQLLVSVAVLPKLDGNAQPVEGMNQKKNHTATAVQRWTEVAIMRLIELHYGGRRYSLNVDFITGVASLDEGGCSVWVLGEPDDRPNTCDESYEEVIRLIQESERGTDEKM